jgi:hypothetical protein
MLLVNQQQTAVFNKKEVQNVTIKQYLNHEVKVWFRIYLSY